MVHRREESSLIVGEKLSKPTPEGEKCCDKKFALKNVKDFS